MRYPLPRVRLQRLVAVAGVLPALVMCAGLPNVEQALQAPRAQQVEFEGANGPVSAIRSEAILNVLEGQNGASDILQKHLAHEQVINRGSPLILGNKLTLLQD